MSSRLQRRSPSPSRKARTTSSSSSFLSAPSSLLGESKEASELKELMQGNQTFMRSRTRRTQREQLINQQEPRAIVVCCSDSRVPPEIIFNMTELGEFFVVRTAGHVLDQTTLESIQYAISQLGCNLIIVLGHRHCGAVSAVYDAVTGGSGNKGQENKYPTITAYIAQSLSLNPTLTREQNIDRSIVHNSVHTADVIARSVKAENETPTIYPAYYDIETGSVTFMKTNPGAHTTVVLF